jgi:hypothetical protein
MQGLWLVFPGRRPPWEDIEPLIKLGALCISTYFLLEALLLDDCKRHKEKSLQIGSIIA